MRHTIKPLTLLLTIKPDFYFQKTGIGAKNPDMKEYNNSSNCMESPLWITAGFLNAAALLSQISRADDLCCSSTFAAYGLARKGVELIASHFPSFALHPPGLPFFMLLFILTLILGA